jgi:hypothetical protein
LVLKNLTAEWKQRIQAMQRINELTRSGLSREMSCWNAEIEALRPCLAAQLGDLRSSVVGEACKLLPLLAEHMGADFEDTLVYILPSLFKLLYVSIKVMSQAGDECVSQLLAHTHTAKSVAVVCT